MSLAAISEQTKIRLSLLEALERDDVRYWPGGIFRRSYFRAYARAVGLDADASLTEFLALYPDPTEGADEVLEVARATTGTQSLSRRPRTRLQFLFDSALDNLSGRGRQPDRKDDPGAAPPVADAAATEQASPFDAEVRMATEAPPAPVRAMEAIARDQLLVSQVMNTPDSLPERGTTPEELPRAEPELAPGTAPVDLQDVAADAVESSAAFAVDLVGTAHLCSTMACARAIEEVAPLMADAARLLHADGLILWMWDAGTGVLWPSLSHGYGPQLLATLPNVRPDTDNAIAAAFRARETRVVDSGDAPTGAVVVPLLTPFGCGGVLALELRAGGEREEGVHAMATILAAQLAALTCVQPIAQSTPA